MDLVEMAVQVLHHLVIIKINLLAVVVELVEMVVTPLLEIQVVQVELEQSLPSQVHQQGMVQVAEADQAILQALVV